jgi:hypothetical protein
MKLSGSDWIFCFNERENSMTLSCWKFKGGKSKRWRIFAIALLSFTAGSLMTASLAKGTLCHGLLDPNRTHFLISPFRQARFTATNANA